MPEILEGILRAFVGAFLGAVGFAMLVHVPKRTWLVSGLVAGIAYLLYWGMTRLGVPDSAAVFLGSVAGALLALILARRMKVIGTVYLMSSIVPVVPGLGLYRMMSLLGQGETGQGADLGIQAMITIAMIALGIGVGNFIDRVIERKKILRFRPE